MRWTQEGIKTLIGLSLQKEGSSLDVLESELRNPGRLTKQADPVSSSISAGKGIAGGVKGLGTVGAISAIVPGLIAALGVYGAHKGNQHSSDQIEKKLREKQQYLDAAMSLRAATQESQLAGV